MGMGTGDNAEEVALLAAGNAAKRADSIVRATAAGGAAPAVLDSSGNAIASATALSDDEREAAKGALK